MYDYINYFNINNVSFYNYQLWILIDNLKCWSDTFLKFLIINALRNRYLSDDDDW